MWVNPQLTFRISPASSTLALQAEIFFQVRPPSTVRLIVSPSI